MPPPSYDEMIKTHYFKHHPFYEFRDFEEFHVDPYRYWLHARIEYWNTETHPLEQHPWEMGSKWSNSFYLVMPFLVTFFMMANYKEHLRLKGMRTPIVGVFSQKNFDN